ncbi:hypothetical protein PR048_015865 [Dryococelus australis]|uniref:Uncharacterized protein n=1 Tax=Dryococelus australis TaxID=614101 RepID=A0ABQ9HI52_9NEOP|nr:hypothetical protein PR048_015865 [Dryococelus australis]
MTSWIYKLSKNRLITKLRAAGLDVAEDLDIDIVRKRMAAYLKGNLTSPSKTETGEAQQRVSLEFGVKLAMSVLNSALKVLGYECRAD